MDRYDAEYRNVTALTAIRSVSRFTQSLVRGLVPHQARGVERIYTILAATIRCICLFVAITLASVVVSGAGAPLVFVQIPAAADELHGADTPHPYEGSRIVRFDPGNSIAHPVNLTPEFVGAQDPEIFFDGARILFAGKRTHDESWDIWEMDADGSHKRKLLERPGDDFQPLYTGCLNTLNDPEWDQILFVSNAAGTLTEDGGEIATALYTCKLDGTFVHRISYNLSSDFDPYILRDGRVLFTSWQQSAGRYPPGGLLPLFVVCTDGIDMMPFYGNHESPRIKRMARETQDGHVVFIVSDNPTSLGGGGLARVSMRRNLHTYEILSNDPGSLYHSPCPVTDGGLLLSYRENRADSDYGIHAYGVPQRRLGELVFDEPGWHDVDVQVFGGRAKPRGRSTVVNYAKESGWLYCLDSYDSDRPETASIPKGGIKRVRLIEGIPVRMRDEFEGEPEGYAPQRILGDVPVEPDGSFHLLIPARTPFSLQVLDKHGQALGTHRSWTWVMPMERRGCIGCHEDRERTPFNFLGEAMHHRGVDLMLPPERRRTVGFQDKIWPVVRESCLSSGCHAGGWGDNPRQVYERLLSPGDASSKSLVTPGSARESRFVQALLETGECTGEVKILDRQRIIEWIDLGAPWKSPAGGVTSREGGEE